MCVALRGHLLQRDRLGALSLCTPRTRHRQAGKVRGLTGLQAPWGTPGRPGQGAAVCVLSALEPPLGDRVSDRRALGCPRQGHSTDAVSSQRRLAGGKAGRASVRSGWPQKRPGKGALLGGGEEGEGEGDGREVQARPRHAAPHQRHEPHPAPTLQAPFDDSTGHVPPAHTPPATRGLNSPPLPRAREQLGRTTPRAAGGDPSRGNPRDLQR